MLRLALSLSHFPTYSTHTPASSRSTCVTVTSAPPSVQITKSDCASFFSVGHCAALRCWICSALHPRVVSRCCCVAAEQATQIT